MKLRNRLIVAVFVGLCLCAGVGVTGAQDSPSPAANQTESDTDSIENQLYDLLVRGVEYSDGEFTLTVEWTGEIPESLTVTEFIQLDGSGSANINIESFRLLPGETTEVVIGAEQTGGTAAILLTTQQSLERGDGLVIQEGSPTVREPVPFDLAALSVIGSALIGVAISIVLVVRKKNAKERGKERIA